MTTQAIGFSKDLPTSRTMRALVDNTDLVIWRSASGVLCAWANRCPHRGMRLSHGFVRGETLACIYHGWQFDTTATCKHIPALPELKPSESIKPPSYSVIENNGVVWVSVTDEAQPASIDEDMTPIRSLNFECSNEQAQQAFAQTPLAPFLDIPDVSVKIDTDNSIVTFISAQNSTEITVVLQHHNDASTTAHVMASSHWPTTQLIALSRWCEQVRRLAELESTMQAQG